MNHFTGGRICLGDTVVVEVTVKTQPLQGNSLHSEPVVVGNSLSKIISTLPSASIMPDRYEYFVRAVDSDGDRLAYLLESGPPGMTIGVQSKSLSGLISQTSWVRPCGDSG